jgi:hypothetical protein
MGNYIATRPRKQLAARKQTSASIRPGIESLQPGVLRINGGTQPREGIDQELVHEYAQSYRDKVPMPPITVFCDGTTFWVADGFHRHLAAREVGLMQFECIIHDGTQRDAILFSVAANATHGKRRTNSDKRRAVLTLLWDDEWSKWSDRVVAEKCAVSHRFASALRDELATVDHQCSLPEESVTVRRPGSRAVGGGEWIRTTCAICGRYGWPRPIRGRQPTLNRDCPTHFACRRPQVKN